MDSMPPLFWCLLPPLTFVMDPVLRLFMDLVHPLIVLMAVRLSFTVRFRFR